MFGEASPGQMDMDAFIEKRRVVDETDIASCTAGQILNK